MSGEGVAESDGQSPVAQTQVSLYVHIIFSTKYRQNIIQPEVEPDLFAYMGGIANNNKSKLLAAGGTEHNVHLLASLSKNIALSEFVGDIKRDSSLWIKSQGRQYAKFHWQDGYGAFSVGYTQINAVKRYIARQKEHHARVSFEDEFRYFLNKYGVQYDERYVWD
jgi:putative transposase